MCEELHYDPGYMYDPNDGFNERYDALIYLIN